MADEYDEVDYGDDIISLPPEDDRLDDFAGPDSHAYSNHDSGGADGGDIGLSSTTTNVELSTLADDRNGEMGHSELDGMASKVGLVQQDSKAELQERGFSASHDCAEGSTPNASGVATALDPNSAAGSTGTSSSQTMPPLQSGSGTLPRQPLDPQGSSHSHEGIARSSQYGGDQARREQTTSQGGERSQALPSGWETRTSKSRGTTYYYNTVTQESSWELPTETPSKAVTKTAERADNSAMVRKLPDHYSPPRNTREGSRRAESGAPPSQENGRPPARRRGGDHYSPPRSTELPPRHGRSPSPHRRGPLSPRGRAPPTAEGRGPRSPLLRGPPPPPSRRGGSPPARRRSPPPVRRDISPVPPRRAPSPPPARALGLPSRERSPPPRRRSASPPPRARLRMRSPERRPAQVQLPEIGPVAPMSRSANKRGRSPSPLARRGQSDLPEPRQKRVRDVSPIGHPVGQPASTNAGASMDGVRASLKMDSKDEYRAERARSPPPPIRTRTEPPRPVDRPELGRQEAVRSLSHRDERRNEGGPPAGPDRRVGAQRLPTSPGSNAIPVNRPRTPQQREPQQNQSASIPERDERIYQPPEHQADARDSRRSERPRESPLLPPVRPRRSVFEERQEPIVTPRVWGQGTNTKAEAEPASRTYVREEPTSRYGPPTPVERVDRNDRASETRYGPPTPVERVDRNDRDSEARPADALRPAEDRIPSRYPPPDRPSETRYPRRDQRTELADRGPEDRRAERDRADRRPIPNGRDYLDRPRGRSPPRSLGVVTEGSSYRPDYGEDVRAGDDMRTATPSGPTPAAYSERSNSAYPDRPSGPSAPRNRRDDGPQPKEGASAVAAAYGDRRATHGSPAVDRDAPHGPAPSERERSGRAPEAPQNPPAQKIDDRRPYDRYEPVQRDYGVPPRYDEPSTGPRRPDDSRDRPAPPLRTNTEPVQDPRSAPPERWDRPGNDVRDREIPRGPPRASGPRASDSGWPARASGPPAPSDERARYGPPPPERHDAPPPRSDLPADRPRPSPLGGRPSDNGWPARADRPNDPRGDEPSRLRAERLPEPRAERLPEARFGDRRQDDVQFDNLRRDEGPPPRRAPALDDRPPRTGLRPIDNGWPSRPTGPPGPPFDNDRRDDLPRDERRPPPREERRDIQWDERRDLPPPPHRPRSPPPRSQPRERYDRPPPPPPRPPQERQDSRPDLRVDIPQAPPQEQQPQPQPRTAPPKLNRPLPSRRDEPGHPRARSHEDVSEPGALPGKRSDGRPIIQRGGVVAASSRSPGTANGRPVEAPAAAAPIRQASPPLRAESKPQQETRDVRPSSPAPQAVDRPIRTSPPPPAPAPKPAQAPEKPAPSLSLLDRLSRPVPEPVQSPKPALAERLHGLPPRPPSALGMDRRERERDERPGTPGEEGGQQRRRPRGGSGRRRTRDW